MRNMWNIAMDLVSAIAVVLALALVMTAFQPEPTVAEGRDMLTTTAQDGAAAGHPRLPAEYQR